MSGIVIIGAGQAGASLVAKLRTSGYDGVITLVGDEPVPPYQRPPLSKKYLLGQMPQERLFLRPAAYYDDQAITLKLGIPVREIDPVSRQVRLGDEVLAYDQLALTTGSVARRLPAQIGGELRGVHCVRSIRDIDAMVPEFDHSRRVLIVGGGYIGLEAAAVAAERGLAVTLVEMAPRILQRVACAETSNYFRALHAAHGVDIREGVGLVRLHGDDRVTGAELTDGTRLDTDFVIIGVGIDPNTRLAQAAGIALDNGIATDAFGATSIAGIWAAGDCASFPYRGDRLRLESVQNAIDQAECVAENMLGAGKPYLPQPWFWSDQYDVKLQIAGLSTGYREVVVRGADQGPRSNWYFGEEGLLAVDAINDPRSFMIAKRALQEGTPVSPAVVADHTADLKSALFSKEQT
ncbi:MAG: FAD-dependent oxidoreductase [Pararhodobacter sp.]|nr:FAD-dependent oxidoreductase [Pararhodobacter sp.]